MPLQAKKLSSKLEKRILVTIRAVVKKGLLHFFHQSHRYNVAFSLPIQIVPKKQVRSFVFGKPEGIRVILTEADRVASAMDLMYTKKRLKFSHAYEGKSLPPLLNALNTLERKYRNVKEAVEPVLIYFLLAPHPYLLVKGKTKMDFFQVHEGKPRKISKERLQKQIYRVLENRP